MGIKTSTYQKLVYGAYAYFMLLALLNVILSFMNSGHPNYMALIIFIGFGAQFYYKHILTNLIMGIIMLLISIFLFLASVSDFMMAQKAGTLIAFNYIILLMTTLGLLSSGILIFSYLKLNFRDE